MSHETNAKNFFAKPQNIKLALTEYAKQLIDKYVLKEEQIVPKYQTEGAACLDLVCLDVQHIWPGERAKVRTGIKIQLPIGMEAQVRSRSGLYFNQGVEAFPGTIDSDYRGEIMVGLINHSKEVVRLDPGQRVAQLAIRPAEQRHFDVVKELDETVRGEGGFGSTDKKVADNENNKAQ